MSTACLRLEASSSRSKPIFTLPEIKADCLGETLAQAIDGLKEGSVPEFHFYKRAAVWGESAKAYLLC